MIAGHKRDSCALIEFLAQLEDEVEVMGVQTWDEISAASRCLKLIVLHGVQSITWFGNVDSFLLGLNNGKLPQNRG